MTARVSDVFARRPARSGPPEQSSVLAALAVPLFVVDGDGHFSFANQAAEQFFDSSTANLLGRPLSDMLPEDSPRSEEHTSELQSLMRISYAVFCLKKKKETTTKTHQAHEQCTHNIQEQSQEITKY